MNNPHLEILIRFLFYVVSRFQAGHRLSPDEKSDILVGLYKLGVHFFSRYTNDKLGTQWMEVPARDNLCLSDKPHTKD